MQFVADEGNRTRDGNSWWALTRKWPRDLNPRLTLRLSRAARPCTTLGLTRRAKLCGPCRVLASLGWVPASESGAGPLPTPLGKEEVSRPTRQAQGATPHRVLRL